MAEPIMPGGPDTVEPPSDEPGAAGPEPVPREEDREPAQEASSEAEAQAVDEAEAVTEEEAPSEDPEAGEEPAPEDVEEVEVETPPEEVERFGGPLRRSAEDQVIAGVCGGLGRYIRVDPALIRIAFVLLAFAGGSGILLYLIAAAVIPRESPTDASGPGEESRVRTLRRIFGWGLVVAGGVLLIGRFVPDAEQVVWPVALLAIGAAVLAHNARG